MLAFNDIVLFSVLLLVSKALAVELTVASTVITLENQCKGDEDGVYLGEVQLGTGQSKKSYKAIFSTETEWTAVDKSKYKKTGVKNESPTELKFGQVSIQGNIWTDVVGLDKLVATGQDVVVGKFSQIPAEAIVGLGTSGTRRDIDTALIPRLQEAGKLKSKDALVCFFHGRCKDRSASWAQFGNMVQRYYQGSVYQIPQSREGAWTVKLDKIVVGGRNKFDSKISIPGDNVELLVDPGATVNIVPSDFAERIHKPLGGVSFVEEKSRWYDGLFGVSKKAPRIMWAYPCDNKKSITYYMTGYEKINDLQWTSDYKMSSKDRGPKLMSREFLIDEKDLWLRKMTKKQAQKTENKELIALFDSLDAFGDRITDVCLSSIAGAGSEDEQFVLGTPFLRGWYTCLDYEGDSTMATPHIRLAKKA